jgi:AbrB family looped-hinge helix DNA binding protein
MPTPLKLSRVQRKGQVTIPQEMRLRYGLKEGDLVAFTETEQGIVITPQKVVPAEPLEKLDRVMRELKSRKAKGR